jgi:methionyl-tRNA formyltransferase
MIKQNKIKFIFFGTSRFSVLILEQLKLAGFLPTLIITTEDKPKGRKLIISPNEVKIWAKTENIPYIEPKTLKDENIIKNINSYSENGFDLSVVASYGKIIPQNILDIPRYKTLNVHPSLLPKLRGPSPIQSAILTLEETGVTIIRLDSEMDHGPIIAEEKVHSREWPPYEDDLENILGNSGGKLLASIIPEWIDGKLKEREQNHSLATYCKKIEKTDGEINLKDPAEKNLRKIRAYHTWPTAYFFIENKGKKLRIIIKKAHIENNTLILDRVVPEGKKEMDYLVFQKNL